MSTYEVETIGNVFDGARCGCGKRRQTIGAVDNLLLLFPPLWPVWLVRDIVRKAQGRPSGLNELAAQVGIDPIEFALRIMGVSGIGEFWPAAKVAGGAVAIAGGSYAAYRFVKSRKKKQHVR